MHFSLLIDNMCRIIVLNAVLPLMAVVVEACKSSVEKRGKEANDARSLLVFNRLVNESPGSDLYKTVLLKIKELKNKNRRTQ
jgi:hypothetical protein